METDLAIRTRQRDYWAETCKRAWKERDHNKALFDACQAENERLHLELRQETYATVAELTKKLQARLDKAEECVRYVKDRLGLPDQDWVAEFKQFCKEVLRSGKI